MPHHCFKWLKQRSTTLRCTAADLLPHATETMTGVPGFLSFYTERIDAGSTAATWTASPWAWPASEHVPCTNADAGVDVALSGAVAALLRRGMDAGQAADSSPAWWS